jgi:hypothetical protein
MQKNLRNFALGAGILGFAATLGGHAGELGTPYDGIWVS